MGSDVFGKKEKEIEKIVDENTYLTVCVTGYLIKLGINVTVSLLLSLLIGGGCLILIDAGMFIWFLV